MRMLISSLKKVQTCYGGILTILLPECHANQSTWSENDKVLFDRVRQFVLELVRSFGCQATKALSLCDNLTWTEDGSTQFNPDSLHARNSFIIQHLLVAGMVPIIEYQHWWNLDVIEHLHRYLEACTNKFAKHRAGPWKNLPSDSAPEMCVGLHFKVMNFEMSDNSSEDALQFETRADGVRLTNLSRYIKKHEAVDPQEFQNVSINRVVEIVWDSKTGDNANPVSPRHRGHSGFPMSRLSCLNDNVTLQVPETEPQEVVLGSSETKLSTLVSDMREEKCSEKLIEDTRTAFMIMTRLKSTTDPDAMAELASLSITALERAIWLLKTQQSTVDIVRGQQDAVLKQVMEVQMVVQSLFGARQRAEEARKKIAKLDDEDEQVAATMATSRPIQFKQTSPVCPE